MGIKVPSTNKLIGKKQAAHQHKRVKSDVPELSKNK